MSLEHSNVFFAHLQNRRKLNVHTVKWHGGMVARIRSFRTFQPPTVPSLLILHCGVCVCVFVRYAIPMNRSVETLLAIVSAHSAKRASLGKSWICMCVCMCVRKNVPFDMASSVFSFFKEEEEAEGWISRCMRFSAEHVYEYPREYVGIHLSYSYLCIFSIATRPIPSVSTCHSLGLSSRLSPSRTENNISLFRVSY